MWARFRRLCFRFLALKSRIQLMLRGSSTRAKFHQDGWLSRDPQILANTYLSCNFRGLIERSCDWKLDFC